MAAVLGNGPFTINDWRVDPSLNRISRGEDFVKIDPQNMKVLELLASRPGEVFSQTEIEQSAWPDVIVTPNSVYQSIAHLRRALGDDKSKPQYIETIARKGYRCVARVELPSFAKPLHTDAATDLAERQAPLPRRRLIAGGATTMVAFAAVIVATLSLITHRDSTKESAPNEHHQSRQTLQRIPASRIARAQMEVGLGDAASELRDASSALRHYQAAIDELRGVFSSSDSFVAEILTKRAWILQAQDDMGRALAEIEAAIGILEKDSVPNNPEFISARSVYAEILISFGRYSEAELQARKALELAIALYGNHDLNAAAARGSIARVKLISRDWEGAEAVVRDVLAQFSAKITDESLETLDTLGQYRTLLALSLHQQGRFDDSANEARKAIQVLETSVEYGLSASALQVLSDSLIRKGDVAGADIASRKCLQILNGLIAAPWRVARAESTRAEILMHRGEVKEAKSKLLRAAAVLKSEKDEFAKLAYEETERRLELLATSLQR